MDRTERFYRIDALLKEQGSVTQQTLLDELEISRATLMRDLSYMRDRLNAPIAWDPTSQAYRLAGARGGAARRYELPGVWFSPSEIHALLVVHELLRTIEPSLLAPQIRPLSRRLERLLKDAGVSTSEVAARVRLVPIAKRFPTDREFRVVADALLSRKRLEVTHHNRFSGETLSRVLSPQRLTYYRDNWYLDAWCHQREDLRSFAVDAFREAHRLDAPALDIPAAEIAERLDRSYGIFNGNTDQNWAKLRFNAYKAQWVSAEHWHSNQRSRRLADGALLLEVPFSDPRELVADILRHGGDCEVLAPLELRALVSEQAIAVLERNRALRSGEDSASTGDC